MRREHNLNRLDRNYKGRISNQHMFYCPKADSPQYSFRSLNCCLIKAVNKLLLITMDIAFRQGVSIARHCCSVLLSLQAIIQAQGHMFPAAPHYGIVSDTFKIFSFPLWRVDNLPIKQQERDCLLFQHIHQSSSSQPPHNHVNKLFTCNYSRRQITPRKNGCLQFL